MLDRDLSFGLTRCIILLEFFVGKPGGLLGFGALYRAPAFFVGPGVLGRARHSGPGPALCVLCRAPALHRAQLKTVYSIAYMFDSDCTIETLKKC